MDIYKYFDSDDEEDLFKVYVDKQKREPSYISRFFNIIDYIFSYSFIF